MSSTPSIVTWMTALADVTRARTLRLVEQHELTVADLCSVLQLPQSTVSRHLKVLADEGWVAARPEGTSRLYRLAIEDLEPAARRLWHLLREQAAQARVSAHDDRRLATVLATKQTRSQVFFNSAAGQWDKLRREMFGERFDLGALAGLLEDHWVVGDLGCGTGQISETLAPFVHQVIAVDNSRAMLKAARQRLTDGGRVEFRQGNLTALPIDDATLDAAVMCLVLHHVADPAAVIREVARVTRPGGKFLLVDMLSHDRREYQQQMGHVWLGFEPEQVQQWFGSAGFGNLRLQPLAPVPQAKGPPLFVARGQRPDTKRNGAARSR